MRRAVLAALSSALLLAACSKDVEQRGFVMNQDIVAELRPGVQTRDAVRRAMGSPSSVAPFDKDLWYYIGETQESVSFFEPTVTERHILILKFDDAGTLQSVRRLDGNDARAVQIVERETPTAGHELTILQQLLGNVGRFVKKDEGS